MQENAAKAGVTINVIREASDSYWSVVWLKKPFCMSQWNQRPVTDMMLSIAYLSTASWNDTHWKRPDFDKLVLQARGELDPVKRKELYWECQRMIHEDGGYIIPAFENVLDAGLSKVQGFEPAPARQPRVLAVGRSLDRGMMLALVGQRLLIGLATIWVSLGPRLRGVRGPPGRRCLSRDGQGGNQGKS